MRYFLIIVFFTFIEISYCQNTSTENLINQVISDEFPERYNSYYLLKKSQLQNEKIYDSLQNFQLIKLVRTHPDFPLDFLYQKNFETIDWRSYVLNKVNYINDNTNFNKTVYFVKYNIRDSKFKALKENRKPFTLYVKRKRNWSDKKIFNEVEKTYRENKKIHPEENVFYSISKPIFTIDNKYAQISIFKSKRCGGTGYTNIYKNENGKWYKVIEYNVHGTKVSTSHIRCTDIVDVIYNN